jgi:hypothetical protein
VSEEWVPVRSAHHRFHPQGPFPGTIPARPSCIAALPNATAGNRPPTHGGAEPAPAHGAASGAAQHSAMCAQHTLKSMPIWFSSREQGHSVSMWEHTRCVVYGFRHAHTFAALSPTGRASHIHEASCRQCALHRRLLLCVEAAHIATHLLALSRSTRTVACHLPLAVGKTPA